MGRHTIRITPVTEREKKIARHQARMRTGLRCPALRTDDNNPLRDVGRDWGLKYDTTTRAGVKAMQADGVDMVTRRDRSLAESRKGKAAMEGVREALRRVDQPIQIDTSPRRRGRKTPDQGAGAGKPKGAKRAHRSTGGHRTRARRSA